MEEALRNGKEVERRWTKGVVDVVVERKRRRRRNGKNSLVVVRQIGKGLRLEAPRCCRCACEKRRWRRALGASAEERGAGRGEEHVGGDDGRERKSDREECVREGWILVCVRGMDGYLCVRETERQRERGRAREGGRARERARARASDR